MKATKLYQYRIPCGLSLDVRSTDSPTMALGLLKCKRPTPFYIADILGLNKSTEKKAEQDTENEVVPFHTLRSLVAPWPSPESPNSCTSDDRGYESSVDEPKETEQNPIVLSTSRSRVAYSSYQVREMENVFTENQYPDVDDREDLARVTGLTEHQVKIWFQNRRQKIKKHLKTAGPMDVIPPLPRVLSAPSSTSDCSVGVPRGGQVFPAPNFPENWFNAHSPRGIPQLARSNRYPGCVSTNSSAAFVPDPSLSEASFRPYGYQLTTSTSAFKRYQPYSARARPALGRRNSSPTNQPTSVLTQRPQHNGISIY